MSGDDDNTKDLNMTCKTRKMTALLAGLPLLLATSATADPTGGDGFRRGGLS